jgi:hypothetical protein
MINGGYRLLNEQKLRSSLAHILHVFKRYGATVHEQDTIPVE